MCDSDGCWSCMDLLTDIDELKAELAEERHMLNELTPVVEIALQANRAETEYLLKRAGLVTNDGSEPALCPFSRTLLARH